MKQYSDLLNEIKGAYNTLNALLKQDNYNKEDAIETLKNIVQNCIPSTKTILKKRDWNNLWEKYYKRNKDILENTSTNNNCYYFIDYALLFNSSAPEKEKINAYKLFNAFENVIQNLKEIIQSDNKLTPKLDEKIINVICDGPKKTEESYNSTFKNHLNEIAYLHYIVMHIKKELLSIEYTLPNGKRADFQLKYNDNIYYIDTITIHNTANHNDINEFITNKVLEKFSQKTQNLNDDQIINNFRILPIIEHNDKLNNYVPDLPKEKSLTPMVSLLNEIDNNYDIILETLPLTEEIKSQLNNRNK